MTLLGSCHILWKLISVSATNYITAMTCYESLWYTCQWVLPLQHCYDGWHATELQYWLPESLLTPTHLHCYSVSSITDIGTGKGQGVTTAGSKLSRNRMVRHSNPHESSARVQLSVELTGPLIRSGWPWREAATQWVVLYYLWLIS